MSQSDDDIGSLDTHIGAAGTGPRPPPASSNSEAPQKVGQFIVGQRLGRGGMATVYLAQEEGSGRQVALKLMNSNLADDPQFVERFKAEARATSQLQHPNIVGILGWGEANGAPFMATEFCDGGTVGGLVDALGEVPVAVAVEVMAQFLAGLGHAHQRGVVHRDLKPENLLMTRAGVVKLADFGIARTNNQTRMTNTGMLVGTAAYMSPEQARGEMLDGRSDLYSAGIIFYELLAGVNPFNSDNPATSLSKILTNAVTPLVQARPTVQNELESIIDKLMAFDALDRFSTAEEALAAMDPLVQQFRQQLPNLLAETIKDPRVAQQQINRKTAQLLYGEALTLSQQGVPQKRKAALKLFSATAADPTHAEASQLFEKLKSELNLNFGPPTNPKIAELEAQLRATPSNLQLLTQLSNLYKLEGNVLRASAYLRRYVRLKPEDGYAASQLTQLTGELPVMATAPVPAPRAGPSTQEIMAGIQTGGFKAPPKPLTAGSGVPAAGAPQTSTIKRPMSVVPLAEVKLENPWVALAKRFAPWLILLLVAGGIIRGVSKFITTSAADVDRGSQELGQGLLNAGTVKGVPGIQKVPVVVPQQTQQIADSAALATALNRARGEMRAGNFDEAVTQLDGFLAANPDSMEAIDALFLKGQALMGAKRHHAAHDVFSAFMKQHPESANAPEALLLRGQSSEKSLDFAEAEADYTKFIAEYPRSKLYAEALLSRGELRHRQGQDELAKGDLVMLKNLETASSSLKQRATTVLESIEGAKPQ